MNFPNTNITYKTKDKLMPERGTLKIEKARKLIGYEPKFPLEKGLQRYIEWYKSMDISEKSDFKSKFFK